MSSLFKTPSVAATEVAPAATQVENREPATSAAEQQRKNKKKYNFAATQGSVTTGSETFGV